MANIKHPCVALLGLSLVSISFCSAIHSNDSIAHFTQRQPSPMKRGSQISIITASERRDETKECHKYALHKCGNIFLRVLKLLHFMRDHHSYQVKCSLRQAFFTCIRKLRKKPCWHRKHHINYNLRVFRKKLADSLWSTRSCVLLITSEINQ
ncbi:uncharacterized protein LOC143238750 [Tachypleus tridentatus]|uniref:uncharacterized protein LOC143238750 n=1 Tax=Tachypleus tridentatus TaxID=6853 RepID=UPI003FD03D3A